MAIEVASAAAPPSAARPLTRPLSADTAFMYVLAVLCMVKIYQSRHPDINARAHATFGALAALIALVVWGVLGGGALFWAVFTVLHVFTFLLLSLRIYYVGQFRFGNSPHVPLHLRRHFYPRGWIIRYFIFYSDDAENDDDEKQMRDNVISYYDNFTPRLVS